MEKGDQIARGVLIVAIIAAVAVFAYYQLPGEEDGGCGETVLTVTYQGDEWTYTMCDLKDLEGYTGDGGMKTRAGIKGPWTFTGISFSTLIQDLPVPIGGNVSVTVTDTADPDNASDDYSRVFDTQMLKGNVTVYDGSGNVTNDTAAPVPVLAYEIDGGALEDGDKPLRVAFVVQDGDVYTSSWDWVSSVDRVDVTTG